MKGRILLAVTAVILLVWFLVANKFEKEVRNTYIPMLEMQKQKGFINFDADKIDIDKFFFATVIKDLVIFPVASSLPVKIDKFVIKYNPFSSSVKFVASEKLTIGSGDLEALIHKPEIALSVNREVFQHNFDDVKITLQTNNWKLVQASDDSLIAESNGHKLMVLGKLDKKSNQYNLQINQNESGWVTGSSWDKWYNRLMAKVEDDKVSNISYDLYLLLGAIQYSGNYSLVMNKDVFVGLYDLYKQNITAEEFTKNYGLAYKDPFKFLVDMKMIDSSEELKLNINANNENSFIKAEVKLDSSTNYSDETKLKLKELLSTSFADIFNKIKSKDTKQLEKTDFNRFVEYITAIKNLQIAGGVGYNLENEDFDGSLKLKLNEYSCQMDASRKDKKSYEGVVKISDPLKLINTKTKFAHEVIIPLADKINSEAKPLYERLVMNIENNAFNALSAFNKNAELVAGMDFESHFKFEPSNFEFKVNDKSIWTIISDEKVVNFLKGFERPNSETTASAKTESNPITQQQPAESLLAPSVEQNIYND